MKLVRKTVVRWIVSIVIIYAVFCTYMYVIQDSIVFYPRSAGLQVDNTSVRGFEIPVDASETSWSRGIVVGPDKEGPVIVYFGGNASDTRSLQRYFQRLPGPSVLTNYRGYGTSDGEPSERAIIADAKKIIAWVRREYPDHPLILMGFSLGAGVAAISVDATTDGVILVSPYRSLVHVAHSNSLYRLLPLRILMRHKFDTSNALERFPQKVLIFYANPDKLIPTDESRKFSSGIPHAQVHEYESRHNALLLDNRLWREIEGWMRVNYHAE